MNYFPRHLIKDLDLRRVFCPWFPIDSVHTGISVLPIKKYNRRRNKGLKIIQVKILWVVSACKKWSSQGFNKQSIISYICKPHRSPFFFNLRLPPLFSPISLFTLCFFLWWQINFVLGELLLIQILFKLLWTARFHATQEV